jgi:chaperonin cofactor prefoldin
MQVVAMREQQSEDNYEKRLEFLNDQVKNYELRIDQMQLKLNNFENDHQNVSFR